MLKGGENISELFSKKPVIRREFPHIYKRLNLLLEPRRHLQRLGFVYLGVRR